MYILLVAIFAGSFGFGFLGGYLAINHFVSRLVAEAKSKKF